jgi:hypothetical protein
MGTSRHIHRCVLPITKAHSTSTPHTAQGQTPRTLPFIQACLFLTHKGIFSPYTVVVDATHTPSVECKGTTRECVCQKKHTTTNHHRALKKRDKGAERSGSSQKWAAIGWP